MAGSTGGGIKAVRLVLLFKHSANQLRQQLHPRAVLLARVGTKVVPEDVMARVVSFVILYVLLIGAGAMALALLGMDLATAFGASAASVGNIGPGIGNVGPTENYSWMSHSSLGVLSFLMLVGRLEIYTVLILFHPEMWKSRKPARPRSRPGHREAETGASAVAPGTSAVAEQSPSVVGDDPEDPS